MGVSNVNRRQLDEALEHAPVAAVEVALGLLDDAPLRGGVVERCAEVGAAVIAWKIWVWIGAPITRMFNPLRSFMLRTG